MRLGELDAELEQAYLADRQNARARDIEIHRTAGRNLRADVLAFTAIGGLVSLTITLLFVPIEDGPARDVLLLLAGTLVAITKEVFSFEFGSSRGSKEKQDVLAALKR